jgi:putative redox protein
MDEQSRRRNTVIEVKAKHQGAVKFEVRARQHALICDQPAENGGADEGMTPPEFFLSALASCAAFYAVAYLKKKNLQREGVEVRAAVEKAGPPARLDNFRIEVDVPGALSDADRAGVLDAVHRCLIHNTLLHVPTIHIEVHTPVLA